MKNIKDHIIAILSAIIVLLLLVVVIQANLIVQKEERLRSIEVMARHEHVVNPWILIELISGVE